MDWDQPSIRVSEGKKTASQVWYSFFERLMRCRRKKEREEQRSGGGGVVEVEKR
jgi:hypothetical protein